VVRPTYARVDLDAVAANYRAVVSYVADDRCQIIAVVKANAYGHGAVRVARALESAGASMLACADIEEGVELRQGGVRVPILVFGALSVSDLDGVFSFGLTPTVSSPFAARALREAAIRRQTTVSCHLKIDTGMNRLGFRHDNLQHTLPDVLTAPGLEVAAVYTHYATAEDRAHPLFDLQQTRFEDALSRLSGLGLEPRRIHAANSAAVLRDRASWYGAVRPGLLLYGVTPRGFDGALRLRPAMSLCSRVVAVKGMRAGETAGYGGREPVPRPTTVAVVPAGYADGLDVRLAGRGTVIVGGRPVRIIGSVSMDSITIDVTGLDVSPGDEVVLLGPQGEVCIDAGEVAEVIGTVPHEVLCRTGNRIVRTYAGEAASEGRGAKPQPDPGPEDRGAGGAR
jgi:alanine racemase